MVSYHSSINRLQNDIAKLQKDDASLLKKEADQTRKLHAAREAMARSKTPSTVSSKMREMERAATELATVASKRADIAQKLASKTKDLTGYTTRQSNEDEKARRKANDEQSRLIRDSESRLRSISQQIRAIASIPAPASEPAREYDFFISHASEDKEEFVADLAHELSEMGAEVFYDAATLKVGDSLRRKIEEGLGNSRYGVVVLSSAFFKKEWPARELDGLTTLEVDGRLRILPIWHKVSKDEVASYSPVLADKVALNTANQSAAEIAAELYSLL